MDARASMLRNALEARFGLKMAAVTDQELVRVLEEVGDKRPLTEPLDSEMLHKLVDRLPIDESSLFRNEALWSWLLADLLPTLLDEALADGRPLRALSLGCAAGQEVFSLAMALLTLLRSRGILSSGASSLVHVKGLDASHSRIARARSGALGAWSVNRARQDWIQGYVHPDPLQPGGYQVDRSVLALTTFEQGNLLDLASRPFSLQGHRLVLCQHVLIYFSEDKALEILKSLVAATEPGAVFIVTPIEAHLLARVPGLRWLGHVGVARVASGAPPAKVQAPAPRPSAPPPRAATVAAPPPEPRPTPPPLPPRSSPAELHVSAALAHLQNNQPDKALISARAACYADPEHLLARLLVGQVLLSQDAAQGRRVLLGLSEDVAKLDGSLMLSYGTEISVQQLRSAVRLLLDKEESA